MTEYDRGFEDSKKAVLDKLTPIIEEINRNLLELKKKSDQDIEEIKEYRLLAKTSSLVKG